MREYADLITEASTVDVSGWDFSWFTGRASEARPGWGYQRLMAERLAMASASLDIQTGGGEVLAGASRYPPTAVATEAWPPNVIKATQLLHPRGVAVVAAAEQPPWPFADSAFDLITSRHPATVWWDEIARVLRPGGIYFAQHVGAESMFELAMHFVEIRPEHRRARRADIEAERAQAAGLQILSVHSARTRVEFYDIAAVVVFLRKVVWTVPGFDIVTHDAALRTLDAQIRRDGVFVAHSTRTLIEARRTG